MLVPISWLRKYIDDDLPIKELADKLTSSGSSVERTYEVGTGLDDLIVGEVVEVRPHPNADRLRLAKVNTGTGVVEVVCGAPNLAAGQHIVYAAEGSTIPVDMHDEDRQPFVLKKAKIRGVESNGMICSVAEMGIGEDHDGILVLPKNTTVGQKITEALDYPQTVFDIEVTTNRSDQLSMIGMAREVSALTTQPLTLPEVKEPPHLGQQSFDPIIDTEHCFRLMTQQLTITVGPSPWWMQQQLALAGMRPVNNVVDITNYVMLEYGQPLHAYDISQLSGQQLIARQAHPNEALTTLDGVEYQLNPDIMVIADDSKPLGIAGIMGGESSKITEHSTTILLEAAAFDPINIRQTANSLALRTEASRRFERSVNREMTEAALQRAVSLLIEHANGRSVGKRRNNYPQPLESKQVTLGSKKLYQYLGMPINPLQVRQVLKSLGFGDTSAFGKDDDWEIVAKVPSWRANDVHEEVDLIEEVVRVIGYDSIPTALPAGELPEILRNQSYYNQARARQHLAQSGWSEIVTLSLTGSEVQGRVQTPLPDIALANPLSSEWTHMRGNLLPGMLEIARKNAREIKKGIRFFELGNVYRGQKGKLPQQQLHLGLVLAEHTQAELGLAHIKGLIESTLHVLGIHSSAISFAINTQGNSPLDPQNSGHIEVDGQSIGQFGALPRKVREELDLPESTLLAEIVIGDLLESTTRRPQYTPPPRFPGVEEDLSLVSQESMPVGTIQRIIMESGGNLLESAELKEIYRHPSLGEQTKSTTFHIVFRSSDKTLSSKEVTQVRQAIIKALEMEDVRVRK